MDNGIHRQGGPAQTFVAHDELTLTLANQAPEFTAFPEIQGTDGAISTQLVAEDPDGDRSLRFRLLSGPTGMTVDPVTGRLRWQPGPNDIGTHAVEVGVADAQGAENAMRFELNVSGGGAGGEPVPAKRDGTAAEDELE